MYEPDMNSLAIETQITYINRLIREQIRVWRQDDGLTPDEVRSKMLELTRSITDCMERRVSG